MKLFTIETGFFYTDGGAMFGVMSRKVWSRKYPVDADNRCPLAMRCLFADFGERKVLFDAGVGGKPTGMSYYGFHDVVDIEKSLESQGYAASQVTDVVLSHLHFDHCGGCTKGLPDGRIVMTFPNARHWTTLQQWENSLHPTFWEEDAYLRENLQAVHEAGKLELLTRDTQLFPGLTLRIFQGHTCGQLVSFIESPAGNWVFPGDVVPMAMHVTQGCVAAIDNAASVSAEEKMRMMDEAETTRSRLIFYHDATTAHAALHRGNGHFTPTERSSASPNMINLL